jgi:hypothetical protein
VKDDYDGSTGYALIIYVGKVTSQELLLLAHTLSRGYGLARMPVFLNALTTALGC